VEKVHGGWELLDELCQRFNVNYAVVDAMPDTRGAKAFATRMYGKPYVFRCYYKQLGMEHDWDWGDQRVTAVRTLSLDETFGAFRQRQSLLPLKGDELAGGAYFEHMQALVRTTEPDDFGQPIPAYRHTRPDDFAHAENYVSILANYLGRHQSWWE
jgi:hypothetical protein